MRSNPADFEMAAPGTLEGALQLMAREPGQWTPIAGGTEIMVLFSAGRLASRKLMNVWNLPELRTIRENEETLTLGGGCTFSQLRASAAVQRHFPLLAQAASWTGSIANQNRGTLAGNLANGSPAADSPPALLAYDAEIDLASARGIRSLPYRQFHLAYKATALHPDELILSVRLNKRFEHHYSYGRKTGARNAQAISKVCIAGIGKLDAGRVKEIRIGIGAVAPVPLRLYSVEDLVRGRSLDERLIAEARHAVDAEIAPIDDIRSVAEYRRFVAENLVEDFLRGLANSGAGRLARWNALPQTAAADQILPCCSSRKWAERLASRRPFLSIEELVSVSDEIWWALDAQEWDAAFASHPRIGERAAPASAAPQSAAWSQQEQQAVAEEQAQTLADLAQANEEYERRFGRVFLICATGKSAAEMLHSLRHRLRNDEETELREAAEQQSRITQLRLRKWAEL